MSTFEITIDGRAVPAQAGQSVLDVARQAGVDIPALCYAKECGPQTSCLVCLVKLNGKLVPACATQAAPGMTIASETVEVREARRTALELLLSDHTGDCLSPCHRLCPLRLNIPVMIRQIKAGDFSHAIVTIRDALALPSVLGRLCHHPCEQGCRRSTWDTAANIRDMERLVADENLVSPNPYLPPLLPATGKSVVIVGSGPTGLTAADHLLRLGHAVTITDRHDQAGGSLRNELTEKELPREVLDGEIAQLKRLGARFQLGTALGGDLTLDGLLRGFDAVLVAVGEISKADAQSLGLEVGPTGLQADPATAQTHRPAVFAAGRAVKPMTHLARAMSEGQAAAECIHAFLAGTLIRRPEKPFSVVMGRLDKEELDQFLTGADLIGRVAPSAPWVWYSKQDAMKEAARCMHCDCRASGNCSLQAYAQAYGADAARYRQHRRRFEQQLQPGGVVFEPGKCIVCGICVRVTELAREPLGLTFAGRGFNVRVATPFDRTVGEALKQTAAECIRLCPTGALSFEDETKNASCSGNGDCSGSCQGTCGGHSDQ